MITYLNAFEAKESDGIVILMIRSQLLAQKSDDLFGFYVISSFK